MAHQDVFIIGATGKVGSTLLRQIFENRDTDPRRHSNPTRVVGLASSSSVLLSPKGLTKKEAFDFLKKKNGLTYRTLDELIGHVRKKHRELVFVDVTALNEAMTAFHRKIIGGTSYSIVTANKNPIAYSDFKTFSFLTKEPHRYGYRCSVMAGADAVPFLRDLRDVGDTPSLIKGCFSGTLGYITSMLEKNIAFSEILKQALEEGYTEPDPRDDLNGFDVARKLTVLARTAGHAVDLKDFKVTPFIGKEYFKNESVADFLRSTRRMDEIFIQAVRKARSKGEVLRYVATIQAGRGKPQLSVRLSRVPKESPLGALQGTLNKIIVVSDTFKKDTPYSVQGPGAGLDITAQNIRRDLLYLLKERTVVR